MKASPQHPNLFRFDLLEKEPEITHFFSTRKGGVSKGEFSSLNFGNYSDDNPLDINENREILARMWCKDLSEFVIPHQVHASSVLKIDTSFLRLGKGEKIDKLYGIDATITNMKNIFLCATTADCVPVLLFDRKNKAVAAIHAGWKGTMERIVEKSIEKMVENYGTDPAFLLAGIGPSIGVEAYEVGNDVINAFLAKNFDLTHASFRHPKSGKIHLDLKQLNLTELIRLGVPKNQIEKTDLCTYKNSDLFFSARRQSVHSGRMLSGIMLR